MGLVSKLTPLLFFFLFANVCFADNELILRQFDVGEGNALLITEGVSSALIDAGNPVTASSLVQRIKNLTGGSLSQLILTHPHQDHIGGTFQLLNELKIQKLYDNGQPLLGEEEPYRWYADAVRSSRSEYRVLRAGDTVFVGKAKVLVLSPPQGELDSDWNKNSLVLKVVYGKFCALLMGDALRSSEVALLTANANELSCPIVQIGHHGSRFASSPEFVRATNAKTGIISINAKNNRGYPDTSTVAEWEKSGTTVVSTFEHGTITCTVQESGKYSVTLEK